MIRSVGVFCASSPKVNGDYLREASRLGAALAGKGWKIVYGGGAVGLMGAVADAALAAGGTVIGVRPRFITGIEADREGLSEMLRTETLHERIGLMFEQSDAFVALPGACGTLDEIVQAITWKRLGLHNKPVALLNTGRFYAPLDALFEQMMEQEFVDRRFASLYRLCDHVTEVVEYFGSYQAPPLQPL